MSGLDSYFLLSNFLIFYLQNVLYYYSLENEKKKTKVQQNCKEIEIRPTSFYECSLNHLFHSTICYPDTLSLL